MQADRHHMVGCGSVASIREQTMQRLKLTPGTKLYYVNNKEQSKSGKHQVHHLDCEWFDDVKNARRLGSHESCHSAVKEAKKIYDNVDGCKHCSPECHTG